MPCVNYLELHNGIEISSEFSVDMASNAGFLESEMAVVDNMDPQELQELLDAETENMCSLEEQFAVAQQQQHIQQEQSRKRKILLDQLDTLQAVKERNELLRKAIAGEIPFSAVPKQGSSANRSHSSYNTPANSPVRGIQNPTFSAPRASHTRNSVAGL